MIASLAAVLLAPPTAANLVFAGEVDQMDVAPDGSAVVFSWTRLGDADLWVLPLPSGEPRPLVIEPGWEEDPRFSPDGHEIAFVGEGEGGKSDVFVVPVDGGTPRNLTAHTASDSCPRWTPDGGSLVFLSDREGASDLYEIELRSKEVRQLTRGVRVVDFELAGEELSARVAERRDESVELRLLSRRGGRGRRAGPRALRPAGKPAWSRDGSEMAVSTSVNGRLRIVVAAREARRVEMISAPAGVDDLRPRFSPRGDAIAFVRRSDDSATLVVVWRATGDTVPLLPIDGSVGHFAWLPDASGLVYAHEDSLLPRSLFVGRPDGQPSALSVRGPLRSLADVSLSRPRRVRIPREAEGPPLGAWLYAPAPERAGRGVVLLRDAAPSAAPDAFDPLAQFLVAKRYAVVIPDMPVPAGPTRTSRPGALSRWRAERSQDAVLAAAWLAREALAAPDRIGVVGRGPLGGHLALAAADASPGRLRAAVSIGGATDRGGLLESAPWVRKRLGLPKRERRRRAPDRDSLDNGALQAVMFVYGREDRLLDSVERLRAKLEARGALAPAVIYEEEGAPIRGRRNRAAALERISDFLMRRL